jgi:hypothetical protein
VKTLTACRVPLSRIFLKFLLCGAGAAVWAVPGTANATLGNYPNTTVPLSGNTTVTPDAAPFNTASINVSTSTNFKGRLEGKPGTGIVSVTDAHPAGTYTVTVTGFEIGGGTSTATFTLTVTTPVTCNPVTFATTTNIGNLSSRSVAIGDFNGDGRQDFALSFDPTFVSVWLGDGTGGFGPPSFFGAGFGPESLTVGDFNGDGKQDLATCNANAASQNVSVLLGDGAGAFSVATNFPVGSQPRSVGIGDFNGDGRQDLAVANENSNNVSVLLGDGAGSFGPAVNFSAGPFPFRLAVGDFNGDNKQDLAVTIRAPVNQVSIFLGDGTGAFGVATNFVVGDDPLSIAVANFNGDTQQDLVTANGNSDNVSVLLGNGAGSFSAPVNYAAGAAPEAVAVGDFNGDGKQDIAAANSNSANVSVLLGDGVGGFGAPINFSVGSLPDYLAVGDFNSDGKQDIAAAHFSSSSASILLRQCVATTPTPTPTATATPANDLCAGAVVIPPAGPFPHLTSAVDLTNATTVGDPLLPSCQTNVSRSTWYTFTPAAAGSYTISSCQSDAPGSTLPDDVITIYTSAAGCAGAFTELPTGGTSDGCDDDSCPTPNLHAIITTTLNAGTQYYILVYQYDTPAPAPGAASVQLRVTLASASATPTPTPTPTPGVCSWTAGKAYPITVADAAAVTLGGNLYVFGGFSNGVAVTPNANKFDGTTWTPIAPLPAGRASAAAVTDGTFIYILNGAITDSTVPANLYRYDPVADTYTTMAAPSTGTFGTAAVFLNGKIYRICGDTDGTGTAQTNTVEAYTVSSNTWAPAANFPAAVSFINAIPGTGVLYAGGGVTAAATDSLITAVYDPLGNTWNDAAIADLPTAPAPHWGSSNAMLGGKWVIGPGASAGAVQSTAIQWDPNTNIWTNLPNAPLARYRCAGATLNNVFYSVGGNPFVGTNDVQKFTCVAAPTPTPPTPTPTLSPTPTLTPTPTPPTPTPTLSPIPTLTPTPTPPTPTPTLSPIPTLTPTPTPPTPTPTLSPTPTPTPCIAIFSEGFDSLTAPALPAEWTTAFTGVEVPWVTSTSIPASAPNDAFAPDVSNKGNTHLITPVIALPAGDGILTFQNLYNMEAARDGMVLEIRINDGAFADILAAGGSFTAGGYTHVISTAFGSPIAGRLAWSGLSGGTTNAPAYITTTVNLPAAASGQNIQLKWRAATDNNTVAPGAAGVRIDNIVIAPASCGTPIPTVTPGVTPVPTATPGASGTPGVTPTPGATPTPTPGISAPNVALVEIYDLSQEAPSRLANLSTRAFVGAGNTIMISGFILGNNPNLDRIVVRGLGPSLTAAGVPTVLANPTLELRDGDGTLILTNNDWQDNAAQAAELIAAGLAPSNNLEAAIAATLSPGLYTVLLAGLNNTVGNGLVEIYDRGDPGGTLASQAINLSTRMQVLTGDRVGIGGFIITGSAPKHVLIRAIGPSLTRFGFVGVLADPVLELHGPAGFATYVNNNWRDTQEDAIQATGIPPTNDLESAIDATLAPGAYTAIVKGGEPGGTPAPTSTPAPSPTFTPTATPTPTPPGGTPSPTPPGATPSPTPPGATPSPTPPGATPSPTPPGATPSPTPPGATPSPTPPAATPTPSPSGPCTENFDGVAAPALPAGWVAALVTGDPPTWETSTTTPDSPPNAAFVPNQDGISDKTLDSRNITINSASSALSFRNNFNTEHDPPPAEVFWDGYVLEVSVAGGAFQDIIDAGGVFTAGPYTGEIDGTANNPLAGRMAWSGNSGGYIDSTINLPASFNGQSIRLRFRMGTDEAVAATGARVDGLFITSASCP